MTGRFICAIVLVLSLLSTHLLPVHGQTATAPQQLKRKLRVGIMTGPPWSMQDEDGQWTGITVDLWREIATILHMDYEFKPYDLNGVQRAVEKGDVDLAVAGLAITSERENRFDFSNPYFVFDQTIAVNSDEQPNIFQVLQSTLVTWSFVALISLIFAMTLLGAFVLWFCERRGDSEHYGPRDWKSFSKALFWSTMILAGRDFPKSIGWSISAPKTLPGRIFGIVWMLSGILMISLFTAGAASVLTSRQLRSIVNSPEDLRHVKVGTVVGAAAEDILKRRKINYTTYQTPLELVKALADHRIDAGVYGATTLLYYSKQFNNKIVVLNFSLRQDFAAIPMPSESPLRKPINRAILQVLDSKRWQRTVANYVSNEQQ
jgi:polar amino acid transport system substrate-binding protein